MGPSKVSGRLFWQSALKVMRSASLQVSSKAECTTCRWCFSYMNITRGMPVSCFRLYVLRAATDSVQPHVAAVLSTACSIPKKHVDNGFHGEFVVPSQPMTAHLAWQAMLDHCLACQDSSQTVYTFWDCVSPLVSGASKKPRRIEQCYTQPASPL